MNPSAALQTNAALQSGGRVGAAAQPSHSPNAAAAPLSSLAFQFALAYPAPMEATVARIFAALSTADQIDAVKEAGHVRRACAARGGKPALGAAAFLALKPWRR